MFSSDEDWNSNSEPVIVLSHSLWVRRFNSDPGVVGETVRINGHQFTVLGVARQDFVGTEPQVPDFWAPLTTQPQMTPANDELHDRGSFWLQVIARIKPGVSLAGAQARGTVEQSWGFFTNGRKPKRVVKALPWLKVNSK